MFNLTSFSLGLSEQPVPFSLCVCAHLRNSPNQNASSLSDWKRYPPSTWRQARAAFHTHTQTHTHARTHTCTHARTHTPYTYQSSPSHLVSLIYAKKASKWHKDEHTLFFIDLWECLNELKEKNGSHFILGGLNYLHKKISTAIEVGYG